LSLENNLPTFRLNAPVTSVLLPKVMTTGAFSRNVGKLFSELKMIADNLSSSTDCQMQERIPTFLDKTI